MSLIEPRALRKRDSNVWERQENEWYLESEWVSQRLFAVEQFTGLIVDPACGIGRIPAAARACGHEAVGYDLVKRADWCTGGYNFLKPEFPYEILCDGNVVSNPPYAQYREFAETALKYRTRKVAMLWLAARLNAAGAWLARTPLATVYLLTPRPSVPPGEVVLNGGKVGGGRHDFCWLVWSRDWQGAPVVKWLRRDGGSDARRNQDDLALG